MSKYFEDFIKYRKLHYYLCDYGVELIYSDIAINNIINMFGELHRKCNIN